MWERSHTILLYTTDAPKGIKDSLAILKHCFPIGMPRIVMHQRQPRMQYPIAISRPKKIIQIRLTRKEKPPPPYTTSFPNGKKARLANLKHCRPTGMPMIVMHQRQPASTQARPPINPPNRNQRIFPIVDTVVTSILAISHPLQAVARSMPSVASRCVSVHPLSAHAPSGHDTIYLSSCDSSRRRHAEQ